jgi:MinD superfamily P-loop ATPase
MDAIIKGLIEMDALQRIVVVSGLGGSGKTQLSLKFARDFQDRCNQIQFIDPPLTSSQLPAYSLR